MKRREVQYKTGQVIFFEGDQSRQMYIVKSGQIEIYKKKDNHKVVLGVISSNAVIGELAFIDGRPRSATAEAITDVTLMEIGYHELKDEISKFPSWLMIIMKSVIDRLRVADNKLRNVLPSVEGGKESKSGTPPDDGDDGSSSPTGG